MVRLTLWEPATMTLLLAQAAEAAAAADPNTLAGLTVMEWILLLTTIGGGLTAFLKWADARASKREAHEERIAKIQAEGERDAYRDGVEEGSDPKTKAAVTKALGKVQEKDPS